MGGSRGKIVTRIDSAFQWMAGSFPIDTPQTAWYRHYAIEAKRFKVGGRALDRPAHPGKQVADRAGIDRTGWVPAALHAISCHRRLAGSPVSRDGHKDGRRAVPTGQIEEVSHQGPCVRRESEIAKLMPRA